MRSNAHFSKKLRNKHKMSQLFIAVPWKNEVRYQKSERNPSLKIVLTTNIRSFIKISQKMASQIVTTNEKVGDVTIAKFSGQRCDRQMRLLQMRPTKRAAIKYTIASKSEQAWWRSEDTVSTRTAISDQVRVFNLTTYLVISIFCRAVLTLAAF